MQVSRRTLWVVAVVAVVASMLTWVAPQLAGAFSDAADEPVHADFTLEACRLTAGTSLPIAGKFICPDADYTTGNLGKSWNELDLVPHRVTVSGSGETKFVIAADNEDAGHPGYDIISEPVINTDKSDAGCSVSSSAQLVQSPGQGGADKTIYRVVTLEVPTNGTCVIDYYQRLALAEPHPVMDGDLANAPLLDLSAEMPPVDGLAIGRYDEQRSIYVAPEFQTQKQPANGPYIGNGSPTPSPVRQTSVDSLVNILTTQYNFPNPGNSSSQCVTSRLPAVGPVSVATVLLSSFAMALGPVPFERCVSIV